MDGSRLRKYWSSEVSAMIDTYKQFETLVPSETRSGSFHPGEDGRYVEALIRAYLQRYLPSDLEVLTGFILRPAVITGRDGKERKNETDKHSKQLDIIVFDSAHYSIFQRFDRNAIVPPEGVVAVISVKKHIRTGDVKEECERLWKTASLCSCLTLSSAPMRPPFLAIVGMGTVIKENPKNNMSKTLSVAAMDELKAAYAADPLPAFDELVGFVGALDSWSITKRRPDRNANNSARYHRLVHATQDGHLGLHLILSGVLSVYYDESRGGSRRRPGVTGFESRRQKDAEELVKFNGNVACPRR